MRWLAACKLRWQTGCEGEILEMAMMYEDDIWCQCYCDAWWGFVLVDVCMLLDPYAATWPCHILPPQDTYLHIDGLVQERRNSIANALELRLYCTNPSLWSQNLGDGHDVWRWYQCRCYCDAWWWFFMVDVCYWTPMQPPGHATYWCHHPNTQL